MEWIFAQCSVFLGGNLPIVAGLALAGLMGSFSHCSLMCAPLVAAQMIDLKSKNKNRRLMIWYHAGRVSAYALMGVVAALAAGWIFSAAGDVVRSVLLVLAGGMFVWSALRPRRSHGCCETPALGLRRWVDAHVSATVSYYFRGVCMACMPCGMLVSALMLAATASSPMQAGAGMMLFGLATVPVLQLMGHGALRVSRHFPKTSAITGRSVMVANGLLLCGLGMSLVAFGH